MYININKKWQLALEFIMIVLGTFIMGISFSIFLEPNNISTGGFSGLSMIINSLLGSIGIPFLSSSIIYLILNVGLFLFALKVLGKIFAIKALVGILSFSTSMEIFKLIPQFHQYEIIICSLFGGILMGVGIGLVVRFGGSTGGSDMIACLVRNKKPNFSIGRIVICVDAVVVTLSIFAFNNGLQLLPYTIISLAICSYITDFVNDGYKQIKAFYIITNKSELLANTIMNKLNRGCTVQNAQGMYDKKNESVLICLVSKFQVSELKHIIRDIDINAFVFSVSVNEVIGQWTKPNELINNNIKDIDNKVKNDME